MRYEIKYSVDILDAPSILSSIIMHPASFTKAYEDRQVNNIYLDSPNFHCFHQNVDGVPRRKKMRLRWYGEAPLPSKHSTLEIKNKNRELGWKDSFSITQPINDPNTLLAAIKAQGIVSSNFIPVLHNSYQRSYYISQDGLFRITIDTLQTFKLPFTNSLPLENKVYPNIVELKYEAADANRSHEITDFIPFRQTKNSKYTNGILELYF